MTLISQYSDRSKMCVCVCCAFMWNFDWMHTSAGGDDGDKIANWNVIFSHSKRYHQHSIFLFSIFFSLDFIVSFPFWFLIQPFSIGWKRNWKCEKKRIETNAEKWTKTTTTKIIEKKETILCAQIWDMDEGIFFLSCT